MFLFGGGRDGCLALHVRDAAVARCSLNDPTSVRRRPACLTLTFAPTLFACTSRLHMQAYLARMNGMRMRLRVAWHETSYFMGRHIWLFGVGFLLLLGGAALAYLYRDRLALLRHQYLQQQQFGGGGAGAGAGACGRYCGLLLSLLCCCCCCCGKGKKGELGGNAAGNLERRIV